MATSPNSSRGTIRLSRPASLPVQNAWICRETVSTCRRTMYNYIKLWQQEKTGLGCSSRRITSCQEKIRNCMMSLRPSQGCIEIVGIWPRKTRSYKGCLRRQKQRLTLWIFSSTKWLKRMTNSNENWKICRDRAKLTIFSISLLKKDLRRNSKECWTNLSKKLPTKLK